MLLVSAAWDHPFVCRDGTSAGSNAVLCRDTSITSQLLAVQGHYTWASAQAGQFCREVGCWSQGKSAAKIAAFLQEPLHDGLRLIQISLCAVAWCCMDRHKVMEQFLLLLAYIGISGVVFCPYWISEDNHSERAFSWQVAWPWISRVTIATVQELGKEGGRRIFYCFFPLKIFSQKH